MDPASTSRIIFSILSRHPGTQVHPQEHLLHPEERYSYWQSIALFLLAFGGYFGVFGTVVSSINKFATGGYGLYEKFTSWVKSTEKKVPATQEQQPENANATNERNDPTVPRPQLSPDSARFTTIHTQTVIIQAGQTQLFPPLSPSTDNDAAAAVPVRLRAPGSSPVRRNTNDGDNTSRPTSRRLSFSRVQDIIEDATFLEPEVPRAPISAPASATFLAPDLPPTFSDAFLDPDLLLDTASHSAGTASLPADVDTLPAVQQSSKLRRLRKRKETRLAGSDLGIVTVKADTPDDRVDRLSDIPDVIMRNLLEYLGTSPSLQLRACSKFWNQAVNHGVRQDLGIYTRQVPALMTLGAMSTIARKTKFCCAACGNKVSVRNIAKPEIVEFIYTYHTLARDINVLCSDCHNLCEVLVAFARNRGLTNATDLSSPFFSYRKHVRKTAIGTLLNTIRTTRRCGLNAEVAENLLEVYPDTLISSYSFLYTIAHYYYYYCSYYNNICLSTCLVRTIALSLEMAVASSKRPFDKITTSDNGPSAPEEPTVDSAPKRVKPNPVPDQIVDIAVAGSQ